VTTVPPSINTLAPTTAPEGPGEVATAPESLPVTGGETVPEVLGAFAVLFLGAWLVLTTRARNGTATPA
jgi:hypothetical protein